ncbi:MAG TPA: ribosome biogenesis GTPase Der, partial [Pirellulales bacterium]|nr:ribosome biogenesis GTPase Der [Pirellulales bacterium]
KWDTLVDRMRTERWVTYLRDTFRTMHHVPIAFITGQTGKNVKALLNHAQMLFKQARHRVGTRELNDILEEALAANPPPLHQNRPAKIFYGTQVSIEPPTIVLFCNDPNAFSQPYRRYLLSVFRDRIRFSEVPIKLYLRRRDESGRGRKPEVESTTEAQAEAPHHDREPDAHDEASVLDE